MRAWSASSIATVALLLGEPISALAQQSSDRITIPVTDPSKPIVLRCGLHSGSIVVSAYDGKEVIVEPRRDIDDGDHEHPVNSEAEERRLEREQERREREEERREREQERRERRAGRDADDDPIDDRAAGLRRIDNLSAGLSIQEHDNEIKIGGGFRHGSVDLDIKVPAATSVHLSTINDGDIVVRNIRGEIEAQNTNGRVTLSRVTGPIVAHALNGDVVVALASPVPDRPTQLSSMNGDIDLTLPANAKVSLWIRADNGEIYTDFDLKMETRTMSKADAADTKFKNKRRQDYGYQTGMHGTLNGGGTEVRIVNYNGNVYIRKAK